jgi:hypothetical protein
MTFPFGPLPGLLKDSSDILIQPILIDFILKAPAVTFPLTFANTMTVSGVCCVFVVDVEIERA